MDWTAFYKGLYPQAAIDQKRLLTSDSAKVDGFSFSDLSKWGKGDYPSFIDGLKPEIKEQILGDETIGATNGGGVSTLVEGIESTFARIAIIVLGFIFVAVGLSMFKSGVQILPK